MTTKTISWTEAHVKAIADAIPELFTTSAAGVRARLINARQQDILGKHLVRSKDSLHMSLYEGKKLYRMLEALRPKEPEPVAVVVEPEPEPQPEPKAAELRHKIRLRMVEWTALAHHPLVKPLLDKKTFCTPNQLIAMLERAQRDVLPQDRWRDTRQWHSAFYRATRTAEGGKRDALSMLREGIKYQPLSQYVMKTDPDPVVPEPVAATVETTMTPSIPIAHDAADAGLMQAMMTLFNAMQARTLSAVAPLLERMERLETRLAALPEDVRMQVADVVGGPAPTPAVETPAAPTFTPEHERQPRVDVVGLLNGQVDVVKRACGRQWNLRFLSAEEVERQPITAPDAIMLRRFVSHSAQERIKKAGAKLHYANGAAESVIARLNQLYAARLN